MLVLVVTVRAGADSAIRGTIPLVCTSEDCRGDPEERIYRKGDITTIKARYDRANAWRSGVLQEAFLACSSSATSSLQL